MILENNNKDKVFTLVQKFLKSPPVIIWGSGATIDYGFPSMEDLKKCLKSELSLESLQPNSNLEAELGKIEDEGKINKIRNIIRDQILKKDMECLKKSVQDPNHLNDIVKMIERFYLPHPQLINIVTTNYDCVLEYALSISNFDFSDGFTGRVLSKLKQETFKEKKNINIIKVHGSLHWSFDGVGVCRYLPFEDNFSYLKSAMLLPSKSRKYIESYKEPFRTLITKSDQIIEDAKSFLVIGFGFNDEHLTPKVDIKIKEGTPIVIINKKATDSCRNKLDNAKKYCLLESDEEEKTQVSFKENGTAKKCNINDKYWRLGKFMEIL